MSVATINDCGYMRIINVNCGLGNKSKSDLHSNEYFLSSPESKAWKKIQACTGFEPMTSAILEQYSTD